MKRVISIMLALSIVLILPACSNSNGIIKTSLNKEFTLAIGQTATISVEKLDIKFLDVTEDSRCPKDVTCIWAGQVNCSLEITHAVVTEQVKLTQLGLNDANAGQTVSGYSYAFTVEPYPESGKQIVKEDYRLRMTVSKP
jgi:hypothetical protein